MLLQGVQEVVVQVRDRFAGLFDAVFLTEVGLIVIVRKVIESQHSLGVPVGLGFLGGVGGAHAAKLQGVGGGGSGLEVVGREDSASLPGQNGEAAVEGTVILIHAHVHGELRGAHIVRGMGGHAAGGAIRRGLWCDGVQISAVGDGGAGVHLAYHRTEAAFRTGDSTYSVAVFHNSITARTADKSAKSASANTLCVSVDVPRKIAVLYGTVSITHDTSRAILHRIPGVLEQNIRCAHTATNDIACHTMTNNTANTKDHVIAAFDVTTDEAVFNPAFTLIRNTSDITCTVNGAIHTQTLDSSIGAQIID